MNSERKCKRIFNWAREHARRRKRNWVFHVKKFYDDMHIITSDNDIDVTLSIDNVDERLNVYYLEKWKNDVHRQNAVRGEGKNKLRTYRMYKKEYKTEHYVKTIMSRGQRSALAKFRCGVAPIRIETGRYEHTRLPANLRICQICNNGIEDEKHVILDCPLNTDLRNELFVAANICNNNFNSLSDDDKFIFLMSDHNIVLIVARTLQNILKRRTLFSCT